MTRRIALFSDPHACIEETAELHRIALEEGAEEIWCGGDFVDRGPDSGGVVSYCRKNGIKGIMGNHEYTILQLWDMWKKGGKLTKSAEKSRTLKSMSEEDAEWLRALPKLHVFDDLKLVLVHGGFWPYRPIYAQPDSVMWAQLINVGNNTTSWWGKGCLERYGKTEEERVEKEGFRRWYELYDHEYDCVYGHSVMKEPFVHQNELAGRTIGIDTGGVFGRYFTLLIYPDMKFIKVPAKRQYAGMKHEP